MSEHFADRKNVGPERDLQCRVGVPERVKGDLLINARRLDPFLDVIAVLVVQIIENLRGRLAAFAQYLEGFFGDRQRLGRTGLLLPEANILALLAASLDFFPRQFVDVGEAQTRQRAQK